MHELELPKYWTGDKFFKLRKSKFWERQFFSVVTFKVGLSPSKKNYVNCFIESPLQMMKNVFYFILKAYFVFKIFKFLSWLFRNVEKTAWLDRQD